MKALYRLNSYDVIVRIGRGRQPQLLGVYSTTLGHGRMMEGFTPLFRPVSLL